ncbi:glycine betaine ABC transporter substrate-binding protein [Actinomadura flavalba]|uniref:glycine betaine ABC transporter substrate-binding protein n=1 Tax=Actinomadura flavalba TaxID=1120938 RepID=UPI00036B17A0|nr:glycine betaine ABC transporter substrate-binding protein [Actinomadura flavalba]
MAAEALHATDPEEIAGYVLDGRLGEGGQGVVYLAHWARTPDRPVAVKISHGPPSADARVDADEIALVQRVARFCTARVLDAGVHDGRPFLVSEYADGPSLHRAVETGGPLRGADLERLALGTLAALTATHAANVVHRDIKPQNVLLAAEGPRIVDFGVATALGTPAADGGTPGFMAPEQARGTPAGPPADVYGWALTMIYAAAITGPPGEGPFARQLRLQGQMADLPGWLRPLVEPCLADDPESRPTARVLLLRLLGHDEREPAGAAEETPPPERPPTPLQPRDPTVGRLRDARRGGGPHVAAGRRTALALKILAVAAVPALAAALVLLWPHTPPKPAVQAARTPPPGTLTVGSANFPESVLLAEIYAQALEAKGHRVVRRHSIGSRESYYSLVADGQVDLVPEYNGALASYVGALRMGAEAPTTGESINKLLRDRLPKDLEILPSSRAENKDAIAVTRATAREHGLKSLRDLKAVAPTFTLGAAPEFATRYQGMIGLRAVYDLDFRAFQPFRTEDLDTRAELLASNSVQAAQLFTTDPSLTKRDLTLLDDPDHLFSAQNITPLIRTQKADPTTRQTLNTVSTKLTTADLRYMNTRVTTNRDKPASVAKAWLIQTGLL